MFHFYDIDIDVLFLNLSELYFMILDMNTFLL